MDAKQYILITGSSSGIGRETAIRLSSSYPLILNGREATRLEGTLRQCQNPERHVLWKCDLREVDQIEGSLRQILADKSAGVEGFVHCAGTLKILPLRSVERMDVRETMNVNFHSAVEVIRLLVRKKLNQNYLRGIVFISSIASLKGARGFSVYCASKGALDAFMRALAVELAPEVRVNSVLPGAIRTGMTENMLSDPDLSKRLESAYPLGMGHPGDIASAVEFLLSQSARWITGQQMVVDGGRTINVSA
ncbi:MAG TPA: SDR family oxidoreductase [Verrucomicrobiae bacterium]|nr:SDR family oxidoreductase [Verrucomicrobiae bacterium]